MARELAGRVAVVTGGASGIGRAVCLALGRAGAAVMVNYYRSQQAAASLVEELDRYTRAQAIQADVADPSRVRALCEATIAEFGRVDILVNNASYSSRSSWKVPLEEIDVGEWERTIQVDVRGTFLCSKVFGPVMVRQGDGRIINFSSGAALGGDPTTALYGAAKTAIVGLTTALARLLAPAVRVNAVAPGSVRTAWIEDWGVSGEDQAALLEEIPLRRVAEPEEIAEVVLFLASDRSRFVTGQTLIADGGVYTR